MAGRKSERVKTVKKNFMKHHNDGKSIAEIAEQYNVSIYSIYGLLQEIADENGVTRDSLLTRVHKPHEVQNTRKSTSKLTVNPEKLEEDFRELSIRVNNIINEIDEIIKEENENGTTQW